MTSELIAILPDMVVFVAVAKAKSFSRASQVLGMPVSTVSRRLAELEARVGLQLLTRTTRQVELTATGAAYARRCEAILEAAEVAQAELRDHLEIPRGHLRVSATADFSLSFLTPLFAEFARRYPEISFEFDLTPRSVDLIAESFDVAIRMGKLPDSQLTARKLGASRLGLYAAPAYLAQAPALKTPKDLARHECIRLPKGPPGPATWRLLRAGKETVVTLGAARFVANNMRFVLKLAVLGMGVVAIDTALAEEALAAGELVRVLPEWSPPPVPVHALVPSRLLPAKTRLFLDCLVEHLDSWSSRS